MAEITKQTCCVCLNDLPIRQFYKSASDFYASGYLPICKTCFGLKYDFYNHQYQSTKKAMQRLCMAFDIYFDEDLFDACDEGDSTVGNYIKKLNLAQHRSKTFEDTLENNPGNLFSGDRKPVVESRVAIVDQYGNEQVGDVSKKSVEKWGVGFDPVDYEILDSHYKFLKGANPNCDSNQEIFILDLCYTKMQQMKAVRGGAVDDYSKLTETYRKLFQQAGLKTTKDEMKTADDCWSAWVDNVSQYTPEEYYKDKELYKDFDGLGDYYERFAVRPLRNLQLGTSDRDFEFFVHEDDEDVET